MQQAEAVNFEEETHLATRKSSDFIVHEEPTKCDKQDMWGNVTRENELHEFIQKMKMRRSPRP